MSTRRLSLVACVLLFLSLSAAADTLTFIGTSPVPQDPTKYFGLIGGNAQFTLVAPINVLATGGGGTYVDSAVLVIQTGNGTGPIGTSFLYNSGAVALYATSNYDFTTQTGTNPLFAGLLGNSVATVELLPANPTPFLVTAFGGVISSGTYFGSFGGYNLTPNSVTGGSATSISLDFSIDQNGVSSLPTLTILQTTPEPAAMLLMASGLVPVFWRRRSLRRLRGGDRVRQQTL